MCFVIVPTSSSKSCTKTLLVCYKISICCHYIASFSRIYLKQMSAKQHFDMFIFVWGFKCRDIAILWEKVSLKFVYNLWNLNIYLTARDQFFKTFLHYRIFDVDRELVIVMPFGRCLLLCRVVRVLFSHCHIL